MTKIKAHNLLYGTTEKVALNMRAKILHSELEYATGIKSNTWKNKKTDEELRGEPLAMIELALAKKVLEYILKNELELKRSTIIEIRNIIDSTR